MSFHQAWGVRRPVKRARGSYKGGVGVVRRARLRTTCTPAHVFILLECFHIRSSVGGRPVPRFPFSCCGRHSTSICGRVFRCERRCRQEPLSGFPVPGRRIEIKSKNLWIFRFKDFRNVIDGCNFFQLLLKGYYLTLH